ncbi:MAG: hypothetical protein U5L72_17805 [Bacteroidales bacterium]|nr:hypothetical protein [Bacteroidales bacterium]
MKNYYDDPMVVFYTKKLKYLNRWFDTFEIYYQPGDVTVDTLRQVITTSGTEMTVTVGTLNEIRDYVAKLRARSHCCLNNLMWRSSGLGLPLLYEKPKKYISEPSSSRLDGCHFRPSSCHAEKGNSLPTPPPSPLPSPSLTRVPSLVLSAYTTGTVQALYRNSAGGLHPEFAPPSSAPAHRDSSPSMRP